LKQQQAETGKVFNRRVAASLAVNAKKLSNKKKLTVIHMDINNVDWKAIEAYRAEYDEILFDTPGHSEFISVLKDLIKLADTVLVPFHNSIDDFNVRRDVEQTIKSCGEIKAKVYSIITSMNEKQSNNGVPEKLLANVAQTMPIAPVKLYKRSSWLEVKYKGLGVVEGSKDKVAKAQFEALADLIMNEQIAEQAA
ncbi:MAG: division plane positioning ATPase MipZ, partial [Acinetobacter sp.]